MVAEKHAAAAAEPEPCPQVQTQTPPTFGPAMNDETFNLSIRKFLKTVGVKSQHEIEQAVAAALIARTLAGSESLQATMNLKVAELGLDIQFSGTIELG